MLAQPDQGPLKAVLHCNRAAALHAMRRHIDAIADCYAAEALDPRYTRVLQRRADIYSAVGDHYSAMQACAPPLRLCIPGYCKLRPVMPCPAEDESTNACAVKWNKDNAGHGIRIVLG